MDFTTSQVALWHSRGFDQLTLVVPLSSAYVQFSDWHFGIYRRPLNGIQVNIVCNMIHNDACAGTRHRVDRL